MKIVAVGDVSFFGKCRDQNTESRISDRILDGFRDKDIIFCNLEGPLTLSETKEDGHYSKILNDDKGIYLKSNPKWVDFLTGIGFNVISLANNHILDYKSVGLDETIKSLDNHHILHIGAGNNLKEARVPVIFDKNNLKCGLLAYSYTYEATKNSAGSAPLWLSYVIEDVRSLREYCDVVIISLHFGEEFSNVPYPREIELCHAIIDNGANVILGHHPHVLRGIEQYNGGLIAYSLGNFIFDPEISKHPEDVELCENIRESIILEIDFNELGKIKCWRTYPLYIDNTGFPTIAKDGRCLEILNKMTTYNTAILADPNTYHIPFRDIHFYSSRLRSFLKIIMKSITTGNLRNIYLLFMRLVRG